MDYKDLNPGDAQSQWTVDEDDNTDHDGRARAGRPDPRVRLRHRQRHLRPVPHHRPRARRQAGHINPPIAQDDVAKATPGETTSVVDVLANDTDIDSDPATLKIVEVLSPQGKIEDGKVRVTLLDHPQTVPYVIEDEDKARALALIYVPAGDNGVPFVVEGALIEMDKDSTETVKLADHVKSPRGKAIEHHRGRHHLGVARHSPSRASAKGRDEITLTSRGGYIGPGRAHARGERPGERRTTRTCGRHTCPSPSRSDPRCRCCAAPTRRSCSPPVAARARSTSRPTAVPGCPSG